MSWSLSSMNAPSGLICIATHLREKSNQLWSYPCKNLENIHLYLWLLKDLSWAQDWYYSGMIFGSLAVMWSFFIVLYALQSSATNEIFISVALFLW